MNTIMRTLYFLVPGTSSQFACGGLFAELKTCELAQQVCPAAIVTYQQREENTLFLADVLRQPNLREVIFVISWGFHVPKLARQLRHHQVIYHAHTAGYGFRLPADVPIITVSRNTMGYWGQLCPTSLIYYLPNYISPDFTNHHQNRDIDVLVQTRKVSTYVLHTLVPALQPHCNVVVLDRFVEDLPALFNRSRVYLYDSAEYWAQYRVTEGFGLPPLEAMACGCQVFSSVNSALADYLDPGFNSYKIACYSRAYDVARILGALQSPAPRGLSEVDLVPFRREAIVAKLSVILQEINDFFDQRSHFPGNIPALTPGRLLWLSSQRTYQKLLQKLGAVIK